MPIKCLTTNKRLPGRGWSERRMCWKDPGRHTERRQRLEDQAWGPGGRPVRMTPLRGVIRALNVPRTESRGRNSKVSPTLRHRVPSGSIWLEELRPRARLSREGLREQARELFRPQEGGAAQSPPVGREVPTLGSQDGCGPATHASSPPALQKQKWRHEFSA